MVLPNIDELEDLEMGSSVDDVDDFDDSEEFDEFEDSDYDYEDSSDDDFDDDIEDEETSDESDVDLDDLELISEIGDDEEPEEEEEQIFRNVNEEMAEQGVPSYENIDDILTGEKFTRVYGEVPIDRLITPKAVELRKHTIQGLTASIADIGQVLVPIEVIRMKQEGEEDYYRVISGLRRVYGAAANKHETIPAFIWDFEDVERGNKLAMLLGLVINKQQPHDMEGIWNGLQILEEMYNLKPAQIERLFVNLQGGDAMRLKDVALGEYDEPKQLLFSGEKSLDQCYKLLQKLRKEEDELALEDQRGILSENELAQETIVDEESAVSDKLSPDEVRKLLEMDEDVDLEDSDLFGEDADEGHQQDRSGDGDDDLAPETKRKIQMRDKNLCRVCAQKDEDQNDAPAFLSLLTVHHIIPVHAGGTDDDDNLITLCLLCHHRLHVMEKMGKIMVDEDTFNSLSPKRQFEVVEAYKLARKAIKAGQLKGYSRKQRQQLASQSLKHKFPGMNIKSDQRILDDLRKQK